MRGWTDIVSQVLRDVEERGRDIEGCIKQWFAFVKPNFENFVDPERKVAGTMILICPQQDLSDTDRQLPDIIVPRGVENRVALSESPVDILYEVLADTLELW